MKGIFTKSGIGHESFANNGFGSAAASIDSTMVAAIHATNATSQSRVHREKGSILALALLIFLRRFQRRGRRRWIAVAVIGTGGGGRNVVVVVIGMASEMNRPLVIVRTVMRGGRVFDSTGNESAIGREGVGIVGGGV